MTDEKALHSLLNAVASGKISVNTAFSQLKELKDLAYEPVCASPLRPPLAWKPRVCCTWAHPRDASFCCDRLVERWRAGLCDAQWCFPIPGWIAGRNLRQHLSPGFLLPGWILPRCEPGGKGFCVLFAAAGSQEEAKRYVLSAASLGGSGRCTWRRVLQDALGHNAVGHIYWPQKTAARRPTNHQYQRAGEQQHGEHTVTGRSSKCYNSQ